MIQRFYAPAQLLALSPILYLTVGYRKGVPLARGPLRCEAQFGLIGQIGLKPALDVTILRRGLNTSSAESVQRAKKKDFLLRNTQLPVFSTTVRKDKLFFTTLMYVTVFFVTFSKLEVSH